jgi:hypothetical protein
MMMHDYMVRQGYMSVVMQALKRQGHLSWVRDAGDGKLDEFVNRVLTTQPEQLVTFNMRGDRDHFCPDGLVRYSSSGT